MESMPTANFLKLDLEVQNFSISTGMGWSGKIM